MPLPNNPLCTPLDIEIDAIANLSVSLLGGAEIGVQLNPGSIPNRPDACAGLLINANVALTPMVPFFCILDAVLCMSKILDSIPDSLGPPPDPTLIIRRIADCVPKIMKLLALIPQLSFCAIARSVIELILCGLESLRETLGNLITVSAQLQTSRARIDTLAASGLDVSVALAGLDCAQANFGVETDAALATLEPYNRLIRLLNNLLKSADLPQLDEIDGDSFDFQAGISFEPLDVTIEVLQTFLKLLPC